MVKVNDFDMMIPMDFYLICGYGVPKDIQTDDNYRRYLGIVFNTIYAQSAGKPAMIICAGGKTDLQKPYKRSEAGEIARFLKPLMRGQDWKLAQEARSLSTVENMLYAQQKLVRATSQGGCMMVFCEATRVARVKALAKQMFRGMRVTVYPVDFDLSPNRYLDPAFIAEKERKTLKVERWALRDPKYLRIYRNKLEDRIAHFRRAGTKRHIQEIKKWWETELDALSTIAK